MATSILRRPEVTKRTGLSRSAIYDYISQGVFPRPISLGKRAVGWLENDIDTWIESRSVSNKIRVKNISTDTVNVT
ncbi:MAG: AlpA family transcriptional regulator [endosymbiont of Galathealinum brachiosum]|uniref:AlpA family transcriptional regulator n=1 Tax=endosymbiont of Galathealinum brachiosum TaxID=2200906 RepID=A0A370DHU8_9GAMM|nr:MAG: AlpA family transcriptional regulator [endosymbiont of Galathealinum brachiosum]